MESPFFNAVKDGEGVNNVNLSIFPGDIVRLNKPYKVEDFRNNTTFITALNNGVPPQDLEDQFNIYDAWNGFNYGIVNDILSRDQFGEPRHISLFLYYQQENGVWLMYSLKHGIPVFVDFHVKFVRAQLCH